MGVRENKKFLFDLVNTPSPSGREGKALDVFIDEVKKYAGDAYCRDKFGNTWFKYGKGPVKILLSGHIDEVSAIVKYISDDGIISIGQYGGIDKKDLIASKVILLLDDGSTKEGVVLKSPIHIEGREESYDKSQKMEELRIDIGAETKDDVLRSGIHPGTPVLYGREIDLDFGRNRMRANGLDDKIGVFVAEEIFRYLIDGKHYPHDWEKRYTVYCLAATQEETGCRSVCVAARKINPDISIDFDVTFATDANSGLDKSKYGDISLGKGHVICYGPEKSVRLNGILKDNSTVCQEAAGGAGGTNTDNIQKFSDDCETTLVSIPNRSMHTRTEVCDWRDVESAVEAVGRSIMLGLL
jgi:endoglucanase